MAKTSYIHANHEDVVGLSQPQWNASSTVALVL